MHYVCFTKLTLPMQYVGYGNFAKMFILITDTPDPAIVHLQWRAPSDSMC